MSNLALPRFTTSRQIFAHILYRIFCKRYQIFKDQSEYFIKKKKHFYIANLANLQTNLY